MSGFTGDAVPAEQDPAHPVPLADPLGAAPLAEPWSPTPGQAAALVPEPEPITDVASDPVAPEGTTPSTSADPPLGPEPSATTSAGPTPGASPSSGVDVDPVPDLEPSLGSEGGVGASEGAAEPKVEITPPGVAVEEPEAPWRGAFEPYVVGEPGRAPALTIPIPDRNFPGVPDIAVDGYRTVACTSGVAVELRAASVRGLSHRHYGKVRQDAYGVRQSEDGRWLVVAVADGVSAGHYSHLAAEVVTSYALDLLVQYLAGDGDPAEVPWHDFLSAVAIQMARHARASLQADGVDLTGMTVRQVAGYLAATSLFALVDTVANDDGALPVYLKELGDTSGWVVRGGRTWDALQVVKNEGAEIASSAVSALPIVPADPGPTTCTFLDPNDVLVLMSDGIGDPLGPGIGEVGEFLAASWAKPPPPLEFAAQVDFARKSFDDDRTALAVWPVPPRR